MTTTQEFSDTDRRALASVAVQFFVNGAVLASYVPRLPEIRARLDLSLDELGIMLTVGAAIGLVASMASPAIIERLGTRRSLIALVLFMLCGLVVVGAAATPLVFLIGYVAILMADGVVDVAMNLQGSWISARRHTPVMNRLHGLWSLGTVVGGLVAAQAAASGVSLQTQLAVVAAVLAAALVFVGRGLLRVDEGGDEPDAIDGVAPKRTRARWIMLVVLAASGGFALTVELVSSDWAAFRLSEDFGTSLGLAGLGFVAFTVGMTIGRMSGDSVQVRVGDEHLFRGAIVVSGVGLAVAAFAPHEALVLAGYVIAGLGIAVFFPKLYDDAAKFPGRRGVALTWLRAGSSVMSLLIPTAVGVLAASRLSVGTATAIVTMPCIAGFLVLAFRTPQRGAT